MARCAAESFLHASESILAEPGIAPTRATAKPAMAATTAASAPPSDNTLRQPNVGPIWAATTPPSAEPRVKPQNMVVTISERRHYGQYSEVRVIAFGIAPPNPETGQNRNTVRPRHCEPRQMPDSTRRRIKRKSAICVLRPTRSATDLRTLPASDPAMQHRLPG